VSKGGALIGSSPDLLDHPTRPSICRPQVASGRNPLDGLICIGGDGTINGMQPLAEMLPCVLAPKTIDNDLGLNYRR
jgi:6-phosphofructokinase 1